MNKVLRKSGIMVKEGSQEIQLETISSQGVI
jgi:hypothetical protein